MMENVRMLARRALETVLPPERVFSEDIVSVSGKGWPDEFVLFRVIDEPDTDFADNEPIIARTVLGVNWLTKNLNAKLTRPAEIVRAMRAAGFKAINKGSDMERDTGAVYYGVNSEYIYEAVVAGG